jgi:hypothetical protein
MKKLILLLLYLTLNAEKPEVSFKEIPSESKEFIGNSSTIFSALGYSPSQINYPGTYKDFKVDWVYKDNSICQDFALEVYPIWKIFFKDYFYDEYTNLNKTIRMLGDTAFNIGNRQVSMSNYRMGTGVVFTLYQEKDPKTDASLISNMTAIYNSNFNYLNEQYLTYNMQFRRTKDTNYKKLADEVKLKRNNVYKETEKQFDDLLKEYRNDNWNCNYAILGSAFMMEYQLLKNFKNFKMLTNNFIFFFQAGQPIGKRLLISEMIRYKTYFNQIETGVNLRFGKNELTTFFIESFYYNEDGKSSGMSGFGISSLVKKKFFLDIGFSFYYDKKITLIIPTYKIDFKF